jgi:radical SAM-linked protein
MIGLPTEQDEDVVGVVETGQRMLRIGREHAGKRAEVTVSVSSHVPKPHTPFQWCAQDAIGEIARKQAMLRAQVSERGLRLKYHDRGVSFVEGIVSRGDRRLGDAIELAWRRGSRFDGWEEHFDLDRWTQVFADAGVDVDAYLGTRPVTARLPWDHIDVGLDDGFLLAEYRKALASRLSPPCGKVKGALIHHGNLLDARADKGKLVCYDCGVACDLSAMRRERIDYLESLGAAEPMPERSEPVRVRTARRVGERPAPQAAFPERPIERFRIRYAKLGRAAYLGHLDTQRVLARVFRRAGIEIAYSRGFHPHPRLAFSPALSLGVPSLGELFDAEVETAMSAEELRARLREHCPEGLDIVAVEPLLDGAPRLSRLIEFYELAILPAPDGIVFDARRLERIAAAFMRRPSAEVERGSRSIDVRSFVRELSVVSGDDAVKLCSVFEWEPSPALLVARIVVAPDGSAKPTEVAQAIGVAGSRDPRAVPARVARLGFSGLGAPPLEQRGLAAITAL